MWTSQTLRPYGGTQACANETTLQVYLADSDMRNLNKPGKEGASQRQYPAIHRKACHITWRGVHQPRTACASSRSAGGTRFSPKIIARNRSLSERKGFGRRINKLRRTLCK